MACQKKSGKNDNHNNTNPDSPQFPVLLLHLQAPPHQAVASDWLIDAAQDLEHQTTSQRENLQWRVTHLTNPDNLYETSPLHKNADCMQLAEYGAACCQPEAGLLVSALRDNESCSMILE